MAAHEHAVTDTDHGSRTELPNSDLLVWNRDHRLV